ncbi:MAG: alpha/beta hydrolase fold domain-containing protein [Phycisphaeraceae bacterium]|nr:MAG: alpha/beta hydrolase fold domain-containing protein [Phycisphaeraceae bacterium]
MPRHATLIAILLVSLSAGMCAAQGGPRPALEMLRDHLMLAPADRAPLSEEFFADLPISVRDAGPAIDALWNDALQRAREANRPEWEAKAITIGARTMKFEWRTFGEPRADPLAGDVRGRSLFLSMHGGGNAPPEVNERQWQNQIRLYQPAEGVYLAPRAPTDTWNLWHEAHIDAFFDRIIADAVAFEGVDPDRVYLMGYSAGGDGVYQLAPRMADRFAAAAMMAGHPNEAQPLNLRNLPFAIHMGANDSAYDRNKVAAAWGAKLDELHASDPDGYVHVTKLHEGKGHWMDREDAEAVAWMSGFVRKPWPKRVVWRQDDVTHPRLYWLGLPEDARITGAMLAARFEEINDEQVITIEAAEGFGERDSIEVTLFLHDDLVNLDRRIVVMHGERVLYHGIVYRTIRAMAAGLEGRADRRLIPSATLRVTVPLRP